MAISRGNGKYILMKGNNTLMTVNGGTTNLNNYIKLSSSTKGKGIYINKRVDAKTGWSGS